MGQDISEAKYLCFPLQKVIAWHKKEVKCLSSKPRDHVEKLIKNKNPDEVGPWTSDELVEHFTLQVLHFLTRDLTPKQAKNMGMEHESTGLLCPSSFLSSTWTKKDWVFAPEEQPYTGTVDRWWFRFGMLYKITRVEELKCKLSVQVAAKPSIFQLIWLANRSNVPVAAF